MFAKLKAIFYSGPLPQLKEKSLAEVALTATELHKQFMIHADHLEQRIANQRLDISAAQARLAALNIVDPPKAA